MSFASLDPECERLVADLLSYMTPSEKAGQLAMAHAPSPHDPKACDVIVEDIQQGRIGCIHAVADREQAEFLQNIARDETRLGIPLLFPAHTGQGLDTILPSPLAASASWDPDAVEAAEAVIAREAQSRGINWALDPEIRLSTTGAPVHPGSSGEDIHLAASMAVARIRGLQGSAADSDTHLLAQLDLSELIARPKDEGGDAVKMLRLARTVIDGADVASLNISRLTERQQLEFAKALRMLAAPGSFDGIMFSQWQNIAQIIGEDDVDVTRHGIPHSALVEALATKSIDSDIVDDAVGCVLRVKFRSGLLRIAFVAPATRASNVRPTPVHNREVALALARHCPVLLRNDPALLPLSIDSGDVLLVGPAAGDRQAPMPDECGIAASVLDGIEQLGIPHRYVSGLALRENGAIPGQMIAADAMAIGMAIEATKRAGTVILVLANDESGSFGEAQEQLLGALANANPRLVVVNIGPRPVDPFLNRKPLACHLHAGKLGVMSGHAIAEILTGEVCPCGKLPVSIPTSAASPGLPFGHGLSYADFALTNLVIEPGPDRLLAFVDLRNVSERAGTQVVQLYLRRINKTDADEGETALELAAYQRLTLRGGQARTMVFDVGRKELGRYTKDGNFVVDEGTVEIFIGLSAERGISATVVLESSLARAIAHSAVHPNPQGEELGGRRQA